MNKKIIVFIVGIIFYMIGIAISNKTIVGTIIGIIGGGIMGLSFFLDKRNK